MKCTIKSWVEKFFQTEHEKKEEIKRKAGYLKGLRNPSISREMLIELPWRDEKEWVFKKEDVKCPACERSNLNEYHYRYYYQLMCGGCKYLYDVGIKV